MKNAIKTSLKYFLITWPSIIVLCTIFAVATAPIYTHTIADIFSAGVLAFIASLLLGWIPALGVFIAIFSTKGIKTGIDGIEQMRRSEHYNQQYEGVIPPTPEQYEQSMDGRTQPLPMMYHGQ